MKISRPDGMENPNEFIPLRIYDTVNSSEVKNMLIINKIDPEKDWASEIKSLIINVNVDWPTYRSYNNVSDHRKSINSYLSLYV
jgi:hypothetical protein